MAGAVVAVALAAAPVVPAAASTAPAWVGAWAGGQQRPGSVLAGVLGRTFPGGEVSDQTLRTIVPVGVPGGTFRLRLANLGPRPATFARVTAAVAEHPASAAVVPGTTAGVTFRGASSVKLAPGAEVVSDPVAIGVAPDRRLAVSLAVAGRAVADSLDAYSDAPTFVSPQGSGDLTGVEAAAPFTTSVHSAFWLRAVDVVPATASSTVVAFGDSLTDVPPDAAWAPWPAQLAARLRSTSDVPPRSVVNTGIAANTLTPTSCGDDCGRPGTERFADDVLAAPGVSHVMILEGTNDLARGVPAGSVTTALAELVKRARARGVRVIGVTIPPRSDGNWDGARERGRAAVNSWIRTAGVFDGVVDADAAVRDPARPTRIDPRFDVGDQLHLNSAGAAAVAAAVDTALFVDRGTGGRSDVAGAATGTTGSGATDASTPGGAATGVARGGTAAAAPSIVPVAPADAVARPDGQAITLVPRGTAGPPPADPRLALVAAVLLLVTARAIARRSRALRSWI